MRSLTELRDVDDPDWPDLQVMIAKVRDRVVVRPVDRGVAEDCLHRLQVTARSRLGALALEAGGLLVDHGWLRIYGGGSENLPDLASINGLRAEARDSPPFMLVGSDVLGGQYAIDGGGLGVAPGEVCYFGPDTLGWDSIGVGHGDWVRWALTGRVDQFYEALRWPEWQEEVQGLRPDEGISCYPPPFTVEGRDLGAVSRRVVPLAELHDLLAGTARRLDEK